MRLEVDSTVMGIAIRLVARKARDRRAGVPCLSEMIRREQGRHIKKRLQFTPPSQL